MTLFILKVRYNGTERKIFYTIVSAEQYQHLAKRIKEIDNATFINFLQIKKITDVFFSQAKDRQTLITKENSFFEKDTCDF